MIETIKQISSLTQQLIKQHEKQLEIFQQNISKIENAEQRAFLEDAMKKARTGELNMNDFINTIQKWQQK